MRKDEIQCTLKHGSEAQQIRIGQAISSEWLMCFQIWTQSQTKNRCFLFHFSCFPWLFCICANHTRCRWHFSKKNPVENQRLTQNGSAWQSSRLLLLVCLTNWNTALQPPILLSHYFSFFAKLSVLGMDSPHISGGQSTAIIWCLQITCSTKEAYSILGRCLKMKGKWIVSTAFVCFCAGNSIFLANVLQQNSILRLIQI